MTLDLVDFKKLTAEERAAYILGIYALSLEFDLEVLNIKKWQIKLKVKCELIEKVFKKLPLAEITKRLKGLDDIQDESFLYFRFRTESELYSKCAKKKEAARLVMYVIRKRGYSLHLSGYGKQNRSSKALVRDLQTQPYIDAINILGLKDVFDAFLEDHLKFDKEYTRKAILIAEKSDYDPAELMKEAYRAYMDFVSIVDIYRRDDEENEQLDLLARTIEEHAEKYSSQIKAKETRRKNKKKEEENKANPSNQDNPDTGDDLNDEKE